MDKQYIRRQKKFLFEQSLRLYSLAESLSDLGLEKEVALLKSHHDQVADFKSSLKKQRRLERQQQIKQVKEEPQQIPEEVIHCYPEEAVQEEIQQFDEVTIACEVSKETNYGVEGQSHGEQLKDENFHEKEVVILHPLPPSLIDLDSMESKSNKVKLIPNENSLILDEDEHYVDNEQVSSLAVCYCLLIYDPSHHLDLGSGVLLEIEDSFINNPMEFKLLSVQNFRKAVPSFGFMIAWLRMTYEEQIAMIELPIEVAYKFSAMGCNFRDLIIHVKHHIPSSWTNVLVFVLKPPRIVLSLGFMLFWFLAAHGFIFNKPMFVPHQVDQEMRTFLFQEGEFEVKTSESIFLFVTFATKELLNSVVQFCPIGSYGFHGRFLEFMELKIDL